MIFEGNNMRVIVPLDPLEGEICMKPVREEYYASYIKNIYQMTIKENY